MTEMVEGIATATIEEEPVNPKKPKKIRIAIFFDGTLNNRVNIDEREKNSDIYQEFRDDDEPTSYDNGRTNIAIMEPHVLDKAEDYDYFDKVYVEGQGTLDLKGDTMRGYALGGGESGVADRADAGLSRAVTKIYGGGAIDPTDHYIEKLTIDVFGFSRGAATARYAIHVIFEGRYPYEDDFGEMMYAYQPMHVRLEERGLEIKPNAVEVCFAGLYDTVLSYYGSQYFKSTSNVLQQKAVARAQKVLHLAAADEHRKDFPLHNIKSAAGNGEEYYLPGVHSDVGGSYNMANDRLLKAKDEKDRTHADYMQTTSENGLIINEGSEKTIKQDKEYLVKQGWFKAKNMEAWTEGDELKHITRKFIQKRFDKVPYYVYRHTLEVNREGIHSSYCNIPLKIMAEYARKPDVKLQINTELEDRAQIILEPEEDLQTLEQTIRSYMASHKGKSRAEDWIADDAALNTKALKAIRHKHFHFSASKMSAGYKPRFKAGRRKRYIYDA